MFYQSKIIVSQNQDKDNLLRLLNLPTSDVELIVIQNDDASLGIKEVSDIVEKISMKSNFLKLFLIKDANKLTSEAQNSLLKILEEPSTNSLIALQLSNIDNLLETIKSRCEIIFDNKDFEDEEKNNIEFIFKNFLDLTYTQKTKVVDSFLKDYNNKKSVKKAILAILNEIANKQLYISEISKIEKAYKSVESNVSSKLIFDFISITLSK